MRSSIHPTHYLGPNPNPNPSSSDQPAPISPFPNDRRNGSVVMNAQLTPNVNGQESNMVTERNAGDRISTSQNLMDHLSNNIWINISI
jgi:hypothetical protein